MSTLVNVCCYRSPSFALHPHPPAYLTRHIPPLPSPHPRSQGDKIFQQQEALRQRSEELARVQAALRRREADGASIEAEISRQIDDYQKLKQRLIQQACAVGKWG